MNRMRWNKQSDQTLTNLYPKFSAEACALVLECDVSSIYNRANKLGLKKSQEFLRSEISGRLGHGQGELTRFQPGHATWNKGTRFVAGGRSAETRFKPGRKPEEARNYKPIGSLRVNSGVLERKITDDTSIVSALRWVAVHRLVWIEANGPVPAGHAVAFKPGMRTTQSDLITLDRVELVTRAELMRRNSYHTNYPPEVRQLIRLRGALNRKIHNQERAR
jgi:hypothetical protein